MSGTASGAHAISDSEELQREISHDYSSAHDGIVPLEVRRGTWTHHVPLWITLYAGFSYMALGMDLYSSGYGMNEMLQIVAVSTIAYLAYSIPAAYLGAWRGQTHALMSRSVFGTAGSWIISLLVMILPLGWVGFQANFLAGIWQSLYPNRLGVDTVVTVGVIIAIVGIVNNVLGFTGITAFARYVAAPATLLWVVWTVIKALTSDSKVLDMHIGSGTAMAGGIAVALSFATYGNEPDLFRYAKPKVSAVVPPLAIGLFVGQILFPLAGWIMAARIDSGDNFKGVAEGVAFSLGGVAIIAFILATASQVAVNDANYYESLNAGQNLLGSIPGWRRIYTCALLAAGGGFMAWWVTTDINNFFKSVALLAVVVPTATAIMYTDQLVLPRLIGFTRDLSKVPSWNQAAIANWPGIVAWLVAITYGSYAGGVWTSFIDAPTNFLSKGVPIFQAWVLGCVLYVVLVVLARAVSGDQLLGVPATDAGGD
jgi:purine-cytosine permease-like protein